MSTAFAWESAFDEHDEDSPWPGLEHYPQGDAPTLYEGDQFWWVDEQCLLTVTAVKTKVYTGVVGPAGETGDDYVFYERDHDPAPAENALRGRQRGARRPTFMSVEEFNQMVADGELLPHASNGHPRLPP